MRFLALAVLTFFCAVTFTPSIVFAEEPALGKSHISPASFFYFLKPIREILEIKFAGQADIKTLYELEFANRRIREVNSLVKTPHEDLIQPTLEKYWSGLQRFRDMANLKDGNMLERASDALIIQMGDLQKVYLQVSDLKARRSIRMTINKLSEWQSQLIDQLIMSGRPAKAGLVTDSSLSGCHFLSKEASSSALNEIERGVFVVRAEKCFSNLKPLF